MVVHRLKTGLSHRVKMTTFAHDALVKFKKESGLICTGKANNGSRELGRLCAAAGLRYKSLHKLRHGFATALIERGAPLPDVAKMGGWSRDVKTLGKIYAHVTEKSQAKTASLM
jgi:site-specific recombinase XerD